MVYCVPSESRLLLVCLTLDFDDLGTLGKDIFPRKGLLPLPMMIEGQGEGLNLGLSF